MAYKEGTVKVFANKIITNEVLAQGDGSQTTFNLTLTKAPCFINSLTLSYTVGATVYQATSNASGVITGTHITSGTLAEDGSIPALVFSTAPDNLTDIKADSYTAKGFLQMLLDFVVGAKYTETVGTGDGSQKTFNFTLSNGPLAKGQVRLEIKVNAQTYKIFDDGTGKWSHAQVSASLINYSTRVCSVTLVDAQDNLAPLKAFYVASATEGQDWLVYRQETTRESNGTTEAFSGELLQQVLLKNSGYTYKEHIVVGFRETKYLAGNFWCLNLKAHYNLDENSLWPNLNPSSYYNSTYKNFYRIASVVFKDDSVMPYFISATKTKIAAFIRVPDGIYESFYVGGGVRLMEPSANENPIIATGSAWNNIIFSDTSTKHVWCINRDATGYGHHAISYDNQVIGLADLEFLPLRLWSAPGMMENLVDGNILITPVYAYDDRANRKQALFALEGLFYCPSTVLNGEDTLTQGVLDYIVAKNTFRSDWTNMCMLKA